MIPLLSLDEIKSIEEKIPRKFPQVFLEYTSKHTNFESSQIPKGGYFIHTSEEILNFETLHPSSYSLLLFFVDTENQDYYCFDKNDKVVVYAIHT
jgi:hypothetical protein